MLTVVNAPVTERSSSRPFGRALRGLGLVLLAVVLLIAALVLAFEWTFHRRPPAASFPPPLNEAEARAQDLAYLRRLPERDRSFTQQSLAEFHRVLDALEARAGSLTPAELEMGVARAGATANNGHTGSSPHGRVRRLGRVPVRFYWFEDGLFVVRAAKPHLDLLGARVRAIDGHSVDELRRELRQYVGGPEGRFLEGVSPMLESPAQLHAAGLSTQPRGIILAATTPDGAETVRAIDALPPAPDAPTFSTWRELAPTPKPGEGDDWRAYATSGETPLYLRIPDRAFIRETVEGGLYLRLTENDDTADQALAPFLKETLGEVRAAHPRFVAVDLRFDGGGNYLKTASFARELPLAVGGPVFILIGRETFSAGIVTVARLKFFAGRRAVLLGESMGDLGHFYAEGQRFVLPNSRIGVSYATGYHDWEHGCAQFERCFWPNVFYNVAAGDLTPLPVPLTFAAFREGRDPVMEAVLTQVRRDLR